MTKPINCFFVDLSALPDYFDPSVPKTLDGMSAGTFTDMYGRENTFLAEELPVYVAKTKLALESTRDSSGQIVGFPIDTYDHANGQAAGWIVDANMADDGRNIVKITPRWNALGIGSIESDTLRYFSASIDTNQKVIVGGSLTNWPATRTQDHQILLRPIELSSNLLVAEQTAPAHFNLGDSIKSIIDGVINGLRGASATPDLINPVEKENIMAETEEVTNLSQVPPVDLSSPEISAEINRRVASLVEEQVATRLALAKHLDDIKAFAVRLSAVTGTEGTPVIDTDKVTAFLAALPVDTTIAGMEIMQAIATAPRVDFSEHGHGKIVKGSQPLPDDVKPYLTSWLSSGQSIEKFFLANSDFLGAMEDYNLSEFRKE
jgi:hypothetical protein